MRGRKETGKETEIEDKREDECERNKGKRIRGRKEVDRKKGDRMRGWKKVDREKGDRMRGLKKVDRKKGRDDVRTEGG